MFGSWIFILEKLIGREITTEMFSEHKSEEKNLKKLYIITEASGNFYIIRL